VVHLFSFCFNDSLFSFLQKHTNSVHIGNLHCPLSFSFIFGIGMKYQKLGTATRHADVFDVLANVSGILE
jgi:glycopeptide antibiotics resistance protein